MPNLNCLSVRKVVEMIMSQVSVLNTSIERSNVYLPGLYLVFRFEQTKKYLVLGFIIGGCPIIIYKNLRPRIRD